MVIYGQRDQYIEGFANWNTALYHATPVLILISPYRLQRLEKQLPRIQVRFSSNQSSAKICDYLSQSRAALQMYFLYMGK